MNRLIGLAAAAALATAACGGGGGSASASVNGSAHGKAVNAQHAISGTGTFSGSTSNAAVIVISDDGAACADIAANRQPKSAQFLLVALGDLNSASGQFTTPVAAGDYTVYSSAQGGTPPAKAAIIAYSQTDATCKDQPGADAQATSGVVHLTSVSNSGVFTGTFDITMTETDATGAQTSVTDHWTGSFNPAACAAVGVALAGSNTTPACY